MGILSCTFRLVKLMCIWSLKIMRVKIAFALIASTRWERSSWRRALKAAYELWDWRRRCVSSQMEALVTAWGLSKESFKALFLRHHQNLALHIYVYRSYKEINLICTPIYRLEKNLFPNNGFGLVCVRVIGVSDGWSWDHQKIHSYILEKKKYSWKENKYFFCTSSN